MAKIKVMLADGHALVRAGIRRILEEDGEIEVTGETGDGEECMAGLGAFGGKGVCVLILEIRLSKMDGFQVLGKVRECLPEVRVLILTGEEEPEYLIRAMEMGADGYLGKDCTPAELKTAIRTVSDRKTYIQPKLMPLLQQRGEKCCRKGEEEDSQRKWASLTAREREILACVAEGMLNKEIASCLNISEQTVKNHLSSIFRKMDVLDRTQAAVFAMREFMGKTGRGYLASS